MVSFYTTLGEITVAASYFSELVSEAVKSGYGVAGMAPGGAADSLKSIIFSDFSEKGVRVVESAGALDIELHIKVMYGLNIAAAVKSLSHKVKYVVEEATGLKVRRVDVLVDDVVSG